IKDRFYDEELGFYDTAKNTETLLVRPRTVEDNPLPSGQSQVAHAFLRLYGFTSENGWRDMATSIIAPLSNVITRSPLALPWLACALNRALISPTEIAIAGNSTHEDVRQLVQIVHK